MMRHTNPDYLVLGVFNPFNGWENAYVLICRIRTRTFVVAHGLHFKEDDPDTITEWDYGHYFTDIISACEYVKRVTDDEYDWEDLTSDAKSNMPCDDTGYCPGTSCPGYFQCEGIFKNGKGEREWEDM